MTGRVDDGFGPLYRADSRILILGSFPSVKSREEAFYYGHPRNRFWPLMAAAFGEALPETVADKEALALSHGLALWDVIESCEIRGSADASIREPELCDLSIIFDACDILRVCVNGKKAFALYERYDRPRFGREALCLPSTSPANAAWSFDALLAEWKRAAVF